MRGQEAAAGDRVHWLLFCRGEFSTSDKRDPTSTICSDVLTVLSETVENFDPRLSSLFVPCLFSSMNIAVNYSIGKVWSKEEHPNKTESYLLFTYNLHFISRSASSISNSFNTSEVTKQRCELGHFNLKPPRGCLGNILCDLWSIISFIKLQYPRSFSIFEVWHFHFWDSWDRVVQTAEII